MSNLDNVIVAIVLSVSLCVWIGAIIWAYFLPAKSSKIKIPPCPPKIFYKGRQPEQLHIRIAELESENKEQKALIKDLLDENYYLSGGRGIPAHRKLAKPPKSTGVIKPNDGCTSTRSK